MVRGLGRNRYHPIPTPTTIQTTVVASCGGILMMDGTVPGGMVGDVESRVASALIVFISSLGRFDDQIQGDAADDPEGHGGCEIGFSHGLLRRQGAGQLVGQVAGQPAEQGGEGRWCWISR